MTVRTFETADLFGSGHRQIVVLSIDSHGWYQSRLCIFDSDGQLLSSYWHPGHLERLVAGTSVPSGKVRLLVSGINNDLASFFEGSGLLYGVFALDPKDVRGEAPPYAGRSGRGSQLWYRALVPKGLEITRLAVLDRDRVE